MSYTDDRPRLARMITIAISNPHECPHDALARMLEGLRAQWWRADAQLRAGDRVVIRDALDGDTIRVFEIAGAETQAADED